MMEKYGVVIDDEKTKTAGSSQSCPKCGSELGKSINVDLPWCPNCGTEPFEAGSNEAYRSGPRPK